MTVNNNSSETPSESPSTSTETNNQTTDSSSNELSLEAKLEARLEEKIEELKSYLNTSLNGIVAKTTKATKKADSGGEQPKETVIDPSTEAIKTELEETRTLLQQLQEREKERDRKVFESEVKTSIVNLLTKNNYDDFDLAIKTFLAFYPLNGFAENKGIVHFGSGKDAKTVENVVKDFHASLGKRFVIPNLAEGTEKTTSTETLKTSSSTGKKNLADIKKDLQAGKLKLNF